MTLPPDFEQQLEQRLEHTAAPVRGDAVSLSGVAARHSQRVARRRRRQAVAAGAFAFLLLTGGALALQSDEPTRIDAVGGGPSSSTSTSTTTTSSTTTSTSTTTTSSTTTTTVPAPEWPAAAQFGTHGGSTWGVYLAVATEYDAPAIVDATAKVEGLGQGYRPGNGELGCDQGAAEALGFDPDALLYAAALYFADEASAHRFVDLYEPEVVGIAEVQTYCLD
jgi:hypothetical protein